MQQVFTPILSLQGPLFLNSSKTISYSPLTTFSITKFLSGLRTPWKHDNFEVFSVAIARFQTIKCFLPWCFGEPSDWNSVRSMVYSAVWYVCHTISYVLIVWYILVDWMHLLSTDRGYISHQAKGCLDCSDLIKTFFQDFSSAIPRSSYQSFYQYAMYTLNCFETKMA
jgi:hypothetical protein